MPISLAIRCPKCGTQKDHPNLNCKVCGRTFYEPDLAWLRRTHQQLAEVLQDIAAQDAFTGATPDDLPMWQAYGILNSLRLRARDVLAGISLDIQELAPPTAERK